MSTFTYQEWCDSNVRDFEYKLLDGGVVWNDQVSAWGKNSKTPRMKCRNCESRLTVEKLRKTFYSGDDGLKLTCPRCETIVAYASTSRYRVGMTMSKGHYSTEYTMGSGLYLERPTAPAVVQSLALDCSCYAQAADVKDFCAELGYEGDSVWDGIAAYEACGKTFKALYQILGGHGLDRLMYDCEEDSCEYCHTGLFGGTCDCEEGES